MRLKKYIIILLILVAVSVWFIFFRHRKSGHSGPPPVPVAVSKHTNDFNRSIDTLLNDYFLMTEGFVKEDTATINQWALKIKTSLDSFRIVELEKDTLIYQTVLEPLGNAKIEIESIRQDPSLEEKKGSLNILSDNLRNILVIVRYDGGKIYWQESPVAFDDRNPGNWLSPGPEVHNPYLGLHSRYEAGSKEYGGPKDTINFTKPPGSQNK